MFNFSQYKNVEDLKKAYKELAKKHHPDLGGDLAVMQALNEAYEARKRQLEEPENIFTGFWSRRSHTSQQTHQERPKAKPQEPREKVKSYSCADTAKEVREALKEAFPGVKFSVRSEVYSGGASIHVRWTDGPTEKRVDGIIKSFQGSRFDGMTDSRSWHTSTHPKTGEKVSWGADYVTGTRDYSRPTLEKMLKAFCEEHGHAVPEVEETKSGTGHVKWGWDNRYTRQAFEQLLDGISFDAPKASKSKTRPASQPKAKSRQAEPEPQATPASEEVKFSSFKGHDIIEIPLGDGEIIRLGKRKAKAILEHLEALRKFTEG